MNLKRFRNNKAVIRLAIIVCLIMATVWHLGGVLKRACVEYRQALRREFRSGLRALKSGRVESI